MNIQRYSSLEDFLQLQARWNPLLERSSANGIFLTFDFLSLWWKHFGGNADLCILAAYDDEDQLLGLAPLSITKSGPLGLRHLGFIGGMSQACPEAQDFIIETGYEAEVSSAFATYLTRDQKFSWDLLDLRYMTLGASALETFIGSSTTTHGLQKTRTQTYTAPFAPLPQTWDEYLASRSKSLRGNFRRQWGYLRRDYQEVELLTAPADIDVASGIDALIELHNSRWEIEENGVFDPSTHAFYHELALITSEKGWLDLRFIQADSKIISARFDFRYGAKIWGYQSGWDQAYQIYSPGRLLIGAQIEDAIKNEITEYDFLAGESPYKFNWADEARTLTRVVAANPTSASGRLMEGVRSIHRRLTTAA